MGVDSCCFTLRGDFADARVTAPFAPHFSRSCPPSPLVADPLAPDPLAPDPLDVSDAHAPSPFAPDALAGRRQYELP